MVEKILTARQALVAHVLAGRPALVHYFGGLRLLLLPTAKNYIVVNVACELDIVAYCPKSFQSYLDCIPDKDIEDVQCYEYHEVKQDVE